MSVGARIVWRPSPEGLATRVQELGGLLRTRVAAWAARSAAHLEAQAKTDAPWTDRTGAARNGLHGSSDASGDGVEIALAHGVDYGVWLELAHQGRFAIILRTLQAEGPAIFGDLHGLLA